MTAAGKSSTYSRDSSLCKSPLVFLHDICCRGRVERRGILAREIAVTSFVIVDWYCYCAPFSVAIDDAFRARYVPHAPTARHIARQYVTYPYVHCPISENALKLFSLAFRLLCQVVFNEVYSHYM